MSLVRIPGEATISGWTHTFLVIISCHSLKQTLWHRYVPRETSGPLKQTFISLTTYKVYLLNLYDVDSYRFFVVQVGLPLLSDYITERSVW